MEPTILTALITAGLPIIFQIIHQCIAYQREMEGKNQIVKEQTEENIRELRSDSRRYAEYLNTLAANCTQMTLGSARGYLEIAVEVWGKENRIAEKNGLKDPSEDRLHFSKNILLPLAAILIYLGEYEEAIKRLKKCNEIDENNAQATLMLATLYFERNNFKDARESFKLLEKHVGNFKSGSTIYSIVSKAFINILEDDLNKLDDFVKGFDNELEGFTIVNNTKEHIPLVPALIAYAELLMKNYKKNDNYYIKAIKYLTKGIDIISISGNIYLNEVKVKLYTLRAECYFYLAKEKVNHRYQEFRSEDLMRRFDIPHNTLFSDRNLSQLEKRSNLFVLLDSDALNHWMKQNNLELEHLLELMNDSISNEAFKKRISPMICNMIDGGKFFTNTEGENKEFKDRINFLNLISIAEKDKKREVDVAIAEMLEPNIPIATREILPIIFSYLQGDDELEQSMLNSRCQQSDILKYFMRYHIVGEGDKGWKPFFSPLNSEVLRGRPILPLLCAFVEDVKDTIIKISVSIYQMGEDGKIGLISKVGKEKVTLNVLYDEEGQAFKPLEMIRSDAVLHERLALRDLRVALKLSPENARVLHHLSQYNIKARNKFFALAQSNNVHARYLRAKNFEDEGNIAAALLFYKESRVLLEKREAIIKEIHRLEKAVSQLEIEINTSKENLEEEKRKHKENEDKSKPDIFRLQNLLGICSGEYTNEMQRLSKEIKDYEKKINQKKTELELLKISLDLAKRNLGDVLEYSVEVKQKIEKDWVRARLISAWEGDGTISRRLGETYTSTNAKFQFQIGEYYSNILELALSYVWFRRAQENNYKLTCVANARIWFGENGVSYNEEIFRLYEHGNEKLGIERDVSKAYDFKKRPILRNFIKGEHCPDTKLNAIVDLILDYHQDTQAEKLERECKEMVEGSNSGSIQQRHHSEPQRLAIDNSSSDSTPSRALTFAYNTAYNVGKVGFHVVKAGVMLYTGERPAKVGANLVSALGMTSK